MSDTSRLFEAAAGLSQILSSEGIPHAFHGSFVAAVLCNKPRCDEIACLVEGKQNHPHAFRRVRDAVPGNSQDYKVVHSTWTNRLHVSYRKLIPPIEIEILVAGESGPKVLDNKTLMTIHGLPFLNPSEFIRAKIRTWTLRRSPADSDSIVLVMTHFWNQLDLNRIPEQEMSEFSSGHPEVAPFWAALLKKYGM